MIELVSEERCIKCDVCIRVCPTNVFERGPDRLPVIKRQADCQTCFMCEAWCPTDALFVSPETEAVAPDSPHRDESWLIEHGLLGSYRRELGWSDQEPLAGPRRSTQHLTNREPLPIGGGILGGGE
jgi:NAD-dependent dihydropyrimidine dehydrogenase PreA subunit